MNYKITIIMALLLVSAANAKLLDLDKDNINGSLIIDGNRTYEILSDEMFSVIYLGNGISEFRRIIVQDITILDQLKDKINELKVYINETEQRIDYIKARINVLNVTRDNEVAVLNALEQKRDLLKEELEAFESSQSELENMITSNIILSPDSYRIGIVVLIILLIAVLVGKGAYLFKSQTPEKTTNNNKKKGELFAA